MRLTGFLFFVFKILGVDDLDTSDVTLVAPCDFGWNRVSIVFRFNVTRDLFLHGGKSLVFKEHVVHELVPF